MKIKSYIPNFLTFCNAACGILAIFLTMFFTSKLSFTIACSFIFLGSLFDFLDGNLARKFDVESEFGKQLDSFADLITFGIAPMVLISRFCNYYTILIIIIIYVTCVIYRLARHNQSDNHTVFVGVPSLVGCWMVVIACLVLNYTVDLFNANLLFEIFAYIYILIISFLMVSKIKINRIGMKKDV